MQHCLLECGSAVIDVTLPDAEDWLLPNVKWGAFEAFPTPAYWATRVLSRRLSGMQIRYRLGQSLREEVVACLLGGHGVPGPVGVAAFRHLRESGALSGSPTVAALHRELTRPLRIGERTVRYRFAQQKARYIANALDLLEKESPPLTGGRALRDWLLRLNGVGPKTASWIARNWLDADDVAILDIHVLRAGALAGFFRTGLTVERNYFELEQQFLQFSRALGVRAAELDAVIWVEMASSNASVHKLLAQIGKKPSPRPSRTQQRDADAGKRVTRN
jgi:N-glycosylase/DNA lyase